MRVAKDGMEEFLREIKTVEPFVAVEKLKTEAKTWKEVPQINRLSQSPN